MEQVIPIIIVLIIVGYIVMKQTVRQQRSTNALTRTLATNHNMRNSSHVSIILLFVALIALIIGQPVLAGVCAICMFLVYLPTFKRVRSQEYYDDSRYVTKTVLRTSSKAAAPIAGTAAAVGTVAATGGTGVLLAPAAAGAAYKAGEMIGDQFDISAEHMEEYDAKKGRATSEKLRGREEESKSFWKTTGKDFTDKVSDLVSNTTTKIKDTIKDSPILHNAESYPKQKRAGEVVTKKHPTARGQNIYGVRGDDDDEYADDDVFDEDDEMTYTEYDETGKVTKSTYYGKRGEHGYAEYDAPAPARNKNIYGVRGDDDDEYADDDVFDEDEEVPAPKKSFDDFKTRMASSRPSDFVSQSSKTSKPSNTAKSDKATKAFTTPDFSTITSPKKTVDVTSMSPKEREEYVRKYLTEDLHFRGVDKYSYAQLLRKIAYPDRSLHPTVKFYMDQGYSEEDAILMMVTGNVYQ